jgi:hypothetical protein
VIPDDSYRARRLAWAFDRNGTGRRMRTAHALGDEATHLLSLADVHPPEEAAFGLLRAEHDWVLVTSRRIVWRERGDRQTIELMELADARLEIIDVRARGKADVDVLTVTTRSGARHRLRLEGGPPIFGAWKALSWAATWRENWGAWP